MTLPTDAKERKDTPIYSGFLKYFPDAVVAVSRLSHRANEQHNPGEPVHWAKEKSTDEPDALMRHLVDPLTRGGSEYDADGAAHKVKTAWRAMADLQRFLDAGNAAFAPATPSPQFNLNLEDEIPEFEAFTPELLTVTRYPDTFIAAPPFIERTPRPEICTDCGADLGETGHFLSCLSGR